MKAIAEGDPQPLEAPPEVTQLVSDLLSKDPAQRPANAEEVARRLARLAAPGTDAAPRRVGPVTMESDDWPTMGGDPGRTSSKLAALGDQLAELWRWQAPGAIVSPAALCRGRVFFTTVDGLVLCLDLLSGKLLWRHDCGVNAFPAPVAMGTACLAVSYDGTVHALSAFDGAVLWQVRPGGAIGTSPLMCPAGVAVADVDGGVYLLDPANGDTRAYWDLGAAVEASPCLPTACWWRLPWRDKWRPWTPATARRCGRWSWASRWKPRRPPARERYSCWAARATCGAWTGPRAPSAGGSGGGPHGGRTGGGRPGDIGGGLAWRGNPPGPRQRPA